MHEEYHKFRVQKNFVKMILFLRIQVFVFQLCMKNHVEEKLKQIHEKLRVHHNP